MPDRANLHLFLGFDHFVNNQVFVFLAMSDKTQTRFLITSIRNTYIWGMSQRLSFFNQFTTETQRPFGIILSDVVRNKFNLLPSFGRNDYSVYFFDHSVYSFSKSSMLI